MSDLANKHCKPCEGGMSPLDPTRARQLLAQVAGWSLDESGKQIRRAFEFEDYHHTMAFVNAVAWVAHREDHHPDMLVGYRLCEVRYSTHAVAGLSENDFICAARVNELLGGD